MLDEKDLQAIAGLMAKLESSLVEKVEDRATKSESLLLDEMERYDNKNSKRIDGLSKELDELQSLYRIYKNENETINTLLRIIENLEKRVSELEKKIA